MAKIIEVKWAEPKGQPETFLLDIDDVSYCNLVWVGERDEYLNFSKSLALHVSLKNGSDLLIKDGEKLYNYIKEQRGVNNELVNL